MALVACHLSNPENLGGLERVFGHGHLPGQVVHGQEHAQVVQAIEVGLGLGLGLGVELARQAPED